MSQPNERTPHARLERQRGRKSFLTWAFFLAGASAADLLLTGAAKAQEDEFAENAANRSDPPSDEIPNDVLQGRAFDVAEANIAAPPSSSSIAPQIAQLSDTPVQIKPLPPFTVPGQAQPAGTVGAGAAASAQGRVGSSGNPESALPDLLPDLHFGIQMSPQPLPADISLALLGFEVNVDANNLIPGSVGPNLTILIPDPLKGVTNLLDSLTSDLGNLLDGDGLVGGILGEIPEANALNLGELTGLTLTNGIAGLLEQRSEAASAAQQSESGAGQTAAFVTDADEFSAPALLSGGMINFPTATTNAPSQIDELFAEGRHTNYNIALGETSERAIGDASSAQPDTPALPEGTPPQDDQPQNNDQPQNDASIAEQSPFDDFVTRPAV